MWTKRNYNGRIRYGYVGPYEWDYNSRQFPVIIVNIHTYHYTGQTLMLSKDLLVPESEWIKTDPPELNTIEGAA
ncbi:hypothetical protein [Amycolatopsis anabasis]|uniref:hypothetical protein n=1 Tax=Amycolatopsis anabasis TaxID=1840409 RepID=UPI00131DDEC6|nr:hypothetical protein [Amycolatopsis anabasis]